MSHKFVHLHTHSNYSLREGAAYVSDLAAAAAQMGMEALALTDHDGMYGAVRFTLACKGAGIRPILGAELEWGDGYHVTLLAQNAGGWSNLCRLVSAMHLNEGHEGSRRQPGRRPRTSFDAIAEHSEGIFALSGCDRGEVPWLASLGRMEEAHQAVRRWLDVFGTARFAIELTNHHLDGDLARIRRLRQLSKDLGVRSAATNNVHYTTRKDSSLHDVVDCIRRIVPLSRHTAPRQNCEYWLKPPEQMAELHSPEAIDGAGWVAEQCRYEFPLGQFHFPDPAAPSGRSSTEVLAARCWRGLGKRFRKVSPQIEKRLQMELRMIKRGGFCGYFLLVADIVDHARNVLGVRCACRGSAAGCLVAYALGISDVDPIRHDLVFERFMNEHRREIPDIDIDFESARRKEINDYILSTYGDRTAMVAMMETFKARAALREVGKALGLNEGELGVIAKAFPHISARKIPQALEALPEVAELNLSASNLEILFDLSSRLDSYPRHLAMHPSGVILSDEKLADIMPMQRSFEGFLMSQFDKDDVEALGIAKLDVLGVRMFSSITHTLKEIERVRGRSVDIDLSRAGSIRLDDPATFNLIRESRTLGCFQIESPGQQELLGKFQPEIFDDLIIDISLFRPGPMKADMIKPFLSRRMGLEPVTYGHPSLAPILKETAGVIVYHEQVMRVISALTGGSLGEADKIRRSLDDAFDPPDPESASPAGLKPAYHSLREQTLQKAVERGWDRSVAEKIWDEVLSFASFGFCKAHAAAFAVPTYQSAWLKAHYPAEFYCGILTHDPGMFPRRAILADARAHQIPIFPVDVNASHSDYRAEPASNVERESAATEPAFGIRLGLKDVKGICDAEIESIEKGRPWKGFGDFRRRAEVSRPVVEALAHCGAFDSIKGKCSRRELFWLIEQEPSVAKQPKEQLSLELFQPRQTQMGLFRTEPDLPSGVGQVIKGYSKRDRVQAELEVTGMDISQHLVTFYLDKLKALDWTPASNLLKKRAGSPVVVAGVKIATQTPPVRSGKRVIFLTLDDGTGQSNIAFFEEAQKKSARTVFDGWILAVKGTVRRTGARGVSILADEVMDLGKGESGLNALKLWHSSPGSAG